MSQIKIERKRITPTMAKKWLEENNYYNRPMSATHVKNLVAALRNGEWQDNGETIKFNCDDRLIDGQHRLAMIVETGRAMHFWVATGLPEESFNTIDQGKKRSVSDALARDGEKYYAVLASALRNFHVLQDKEPLNLSRKPFRIPLAYAILGKNPKIRKSVSDAMQWGASDLGPPGLFAGALYACRAIDKELADNFWSRALTGENLNKNEPAYRLRKKYLDDHSKHEKMHFSTRLLVIIKCWNAARKGELIDVLRFNSKDYVDHLR